jgi:hypothetical protein
LWKCRLRVRFSGLQRDAMKLAVQVKLLPTPEQTSVLETTLRACNRAAPYALKDSMIAMRLRCCRGGNQPGPWRSPDRRSVLGDGSPRYVAGPTLGQSPASRPAMQPGGCPELPWKAYLQKASEPVKVDASLAWRAVRAARGGLAKIGPHYRISRSAHWPSRDKAFGPRGRHVDRDTGDETSIWWLR